MIVCLAVLAAACSVETNRNGRQGGYTVDIRAADNDVVYVVTAPNGHVAAARSHDGTSAMLDPQALQQALAAMPAVTTNPRYDDHSVSIRAPGFSLQASGDDDTADSAVGDDAHPATGAAPDAKPAAGASGNDTHGRGHVTMNLVGFSLEAEGNGDEGDGRAHVHFGGLSERDARRFIVDADELSPNVQSQMLAALGLSQDKD
jgi:hypothetical protein